MPKFCLLLLCLLFLLCGCQTQPAETTVPTTTVPTTTAPAADPLLERSLNSLGNNVRVQAVLEKLRAGEQITVGFIGGSITEGFNATGDRNYATLVTEYLQNTYGGKAVCLNTGLAGTPSTLGLIRAQRELLDAQPDLIFIEFAVNDAQTFTDKQAYEALIRKCLLQENDPAVILLHSVTENGYTCQDEMALTAFYYSLPAVSVRDAIMPAIENGEMTWADWSNDDVHPHTDGHALYAKMIAHLIGTLDKEESDGTYAVPNTPKFKQDWTELTEYDSQTLVLTDKGDFQPSRAHERFPNSFSYRHNDSTDNRGLTFTVTGRALFIVFKQSQSTNFGTAQVLVNGEVVAHLEGCNSDAWNNPVARLIFSEKEPATYEITVQMQPGDEEKSFDLLSVAIVEE